MIVEIYGKPNCSYCTKAKNVLEQNEIKYVYNEVGTDITVNELKEKFEGVKSVPVVVINNKWIGGYDQLVEYLQETRGDYGQGSI